MNANAGRGVARLEEFGDFRGHRARHHAGAEFDHVDFQALAPGGRGEFQSDEAGADHDDALAGSDPVPQGLAFVEGAQIAHALQIGVGNVEQAIARAGRQHQMAVVEGGTGAEQQFMRPAVDRHRSVGNQVDLLVGKEFFRPEHQAVRPAGSLQIGLGQRRPLVWQMALVVQKRDTLGKAVLAQRGRNLKAGMSGADDDNRSLHDRPLQNRSLRHRDNPIAGAQELPMSSPLTADVGFRLVRAALVSASRTMGTPIRPQGLATRKGVPPGREDKAASCGRVRDCLPRASAI